MVSYLCEITTHRRASSSTQLHHFVLLNKETKNKNQKSFPIKLKSFLEIAVRFFTFIFMCSAYGTRTRDHLSDSQVF